MSEQENIRLAQQAYASFQSGDIQSLIGLMSEEIKWELPEIEGVSFAGKRSGRDQVAEFFSSLADQQDVLEFSPTDFIAQGDKVAVQGSYRWRVKATGREYGGDWVHVFTVRDGRIVRFQEYMDTAAAANAYQKAQSA